MKHETAIVGCEMQQRVAVPRVLESFSGNAEGPPDRLPPQPQILARQEYA